MYRRVLSNASEQLKHKHKKLGKCVDKARPFYLANRDARQVSPDFWERQNDAAAGKWWFLSEKSFAYFIFIVDSLEFS
jgi:hypothetical protein